MSKPQGGAASAAPPDALSVFFVVGEESGDHLGAQLMQALSLRLGGRLRSSGVGGAAMAAQGLQSLFPLSEISLFGFLSVAWQLPNLFARLRQTVDAVVAENPDVLVIIDSPDFTHRVARRVRARAPHIRIVNYVSPSVWAWRPGRARAMRAYVDHVLALLPFEPAEHARLGGPPCTFVGHPLAARIDELRPNAAEQLRRDQPPPVLLVLPGSRRSEIRRLLPVFAETVARLPALGHPVELVLPTIPHLADEITARTASWSQPPRIVTAPEDKRAAFRVAAAALAASGTVTLELALAAVPTVAAYRVHHVEAAIVRRLIQVPTVILANLTLGENVVPEFLQEDCTPDRLAAALAPLLADTPERARQLAAFARLDSIMAIKTSAPADNAAEIVLAVARHNAAASNA